MRNENSGQGHIAGIIILILAATPASQVLAQDERIEEVVVTGFKGSLLRARELKRSAVNVRESIIAEDIGKFPDLNIAEAIQRVPGVAISREGGEGRNITLRGFSPNFTQTTLNSMQVPAGSDGLDSGGVTLNSSRAFDFHVFASELFNRVDIQKTQTASLEEGGIAGTVDLYSAKPFDFDEGFSASASLQAGYNDLTGENDPRIALLASHTTADGRFGALASIAFSERTVRQEGYGSVRWTSPFVNGDSWDTSQLAVVNGTPNGDCGAANPLDCLWAPRLPRADFFGNEQERLGLTGSLQYRPSDKSTLTLDVLHSELDNQRENYNSMEWILTHGPAANFTGQTPLEFTIDSTGKVLIAATFDDITSWYESRLQTSDSEFDQVVLSGDYLISETLTADAMVGWAKNDAIREELRFFYRSVPHFYAYDYSDGNVATVDFGNYDVNDPDNFVDALTNQNRFDHVVKENITSKIDLIYDPGGFSIKTGLAYNDREVQKSEGRADNSTLTNPQNYTRPFPFSDFGTGLGGPGLVPFPVADFEAIARDGLLAPGYTTTLDAGWTVGEETLALYLEFNGDLDVGGMLLRTNFGLRWVDTKITSEALLSGTPVEVERDYDNYLPSMNLALEMTDDIVARLSYGRSMTRPNLGSLNIAGPNFGFTTRTVSNLGNPGLNPYESNDIDLGVEWYFGDEGLLAVNLFNKDIVTNLTTEVVDKMVDMEFWDAIYADPEYDPSFMADPALVNYTHFIPVNSTEGFTVKGYELTYQQPFTFFDGWLSNFGVAANYTHVSAEDSTGLSPNSHNITLYYEQENLGGRISLNSRDDYLLRAPGGNGHVQERKYGPTHVDFSSFYHFNENLTFSLELINLTDEEERIYGTGDGTLNLTREFSHTGRQWFLGARYNF